MSYNTWTGEVVCDHFACLTIATVYSWDATALSYTYIHVEGWWFSASSHNLEYFRKGQPHWREPTAPGGVFLCPEHAHFRKNRSVMRSIRTAKELST